MRGSVDGDDKRTSATASFSCLQPLSADRCISDVLLIHRSISAPDPGMAHSEDEYDSVNVVELSAAQPPPPPRLSQGPRRIGAQTLLLLLVSVALCAMAIKAIVYLLYQPGSVSISLQPSYFLTCHISEQRERLFFSPPQSKIK